MMINEDPFLDDEDNNGGFNNDPVPCPLPVKKPPVIQNVQKPLSKMQSNQDENLEVLKWKNINISIIALTTFMTIIFLQVLA